MDIGSVLREARNRRGLTLEQIARATKVPALMLDHIEHNRFDRLPGSIFTKGYLRAFAAAVGVEGERLVQDYAGQSAPSPAVAALTQSVESEPPVQMAGRIGKIGLGLLAVALVLYFARDASQPAMHPASGVTALPQATAVPTTGAGPPTVPEPAAPWPMHVEMTVSADCWVSAVVDGQSAVYRLVRGGEQISATANNEVVLRVGEPGVFAYRLNGRPGRPLGRPGTPATVRINRDTYRELLESPPVSSEAPGIS